MQKGTQFNSTVTTSIPDSPRDVDRLRRVESIYPNLKYGDYQIIAEMTGFSRVYVGQVLRPQDKRFNEAIVIAAEGLVRYRKERIEERAKAELAALQKRQTELQSIVSTI